jgi:hypothetical protein
MAITNLNIATVEESLGYFNDNEFLEFLRAAQTGNIEGLESFLENRSRDINRLDNLFGGAATHFAARHSQVDALRLKLPTSTPMDTKYRQKFLTYMTPLKRELDSVSSENN